MSITRCGALAPVLTLQESAVAAQQLCLGVACHLLESGIDIDDRHVLRQRKSAVGTGEDGIFHYGHGTPTVFLQRFFNGFGQAVNLAAAAA